MDDKLGQSCIEPGIREGESLGWRLSNVDTRIASPCGGNERFGRLYRRHGFGSQSCDQLSGEGSGPAADIEDPLPFAHRGEFGQLTGK